MELFLNSAEEAVTPALYRYKNHFLLQPLLADYIRKRNLWSVFDRCINGTLDCGLVSEDAVKGTEWVIARRPLPADCDMHWVFPANPDTFEDLLSYLGSGNFGQMLK